MFITRNFFTFYFTVLCLAAQGCAPSLPKYKKNPDDKIAIPQNFPNQNYHKNSDEENLVNKDWRRFFKDRQLIELIEIALQNNQELNIIDQEISISNNEVMARQGQYFPKVEIGGGYESDKTSKFTSRGASDDAAGLNDKLRTRELGLAATWEIDIWKKLRNSAKSAYFQYLASIEGRNFAATRLVAEISADYYELMALDNEIEIIRQFVATLKQAQEVAKLQQIAGRITSLPVKRFDAEVLQNESREYKIQQQIIITENHLNKLLGRLPQAISRSSNKFMAMTMPLVATNIPSALLDNRPDVKQASLQIEAAKLNVQAVKSQFYPALTINSAVGYASFNAHHFIDPASVVYNIAGGITAPLLNRKAIKADYFSANNKQIEAVYNYEQTFINAFAEVTNQVAAVKNLQEIYELKSQQTKALSDSFEISNILFKAARVDYLESLLTRRDYLESQLELIEVKQQQLTAYVNLYRALGGGWRQDNPQSVN